MKLKMFKLLKLPSTKKMRGTGKRVSEIIDTFGHTQIEMTANSRKGSSVVGNIAITDSIKAASYTKLVELDNTNSEGKDEHIQRAKKLTVIQMKASLSSYFDDAQELHKIKNKIRGKYDISDMSIFFIIIIIMKSHYCKV